MLAADDVEDVNQSGQRAGRVLTVARRRTDCVDDLGLGVGFGPDGFGHFQKSFQLECGLRNDQRRVQGRQLLNFTGVADDERVIGRVTNHANHLRMIRIARDHDVAAVFRGALSESLHPVHERAGGIDDAGGALFQFGLYLRRHPVRANYGDLVGPDFRGILDGGDAFTFQALHFLRVVNQRAQCAHWRADLERALDHFDRALDTKTKSVFVCQ